MFTFIENKYDKKNETIKHLMSGAMSAMGILRRNVLFAKTILLERQSTGLVFCMTQNDDRSYITADTSVHSDALFTMQLRLKGVKR